MSEPSVVDVTDRYELWMRSTLPFLQEDHLAEKHKEIKKASANSAFKFLRGTFYLWSTRLPRLLPDLVGRSVPQVLGLGDVHIENFGMWRDSEGRLIWGANDTDEATTMPYTQDLVRLMTSAALGGMDIDLEDIAEDVTSGYRRHLETGPHPFVLAHADEQLWQLVRAQTGDPVEWWNRLDAKLEKLAEQPSADVKSYVQVSFPGDPVTELSWHTHAAGMGSLGRPRIVLTGQWRGGRICREAKGALPSAWDWANDSAKEPTPLGRLLKGTTRPIDPYAAVVGDWSIRRLAPDSDKIDVQALHNSADRRSLLRSMGGELANIHLTQMSPEPIRKHLNQVGNQLLQATKTMVKKVQEDQEQYASS